MTECVYCHSYSDYKDHPQGRLEPGERCGRCGATREEERAETERHQSRALEEFGSGGEVGR